MLLFVAAQCDGKAFTLQAIGRVAARATYEESGGGIRARGLAEAGQTGKPSNRSKQGAMQPELAAIREWRRRCR
jgi:hypothetical protein